MEALNDVYADACKKHCEEIVEKEVVPHRDGPWFLGYSMTDRPVYMKLDAASRVNNTYGGFRDVLPTWPNVLRNLPGSATGKKAYTRYVGERYSNDFMEFNAVYKTAYGAFEEIESREEWRIAVDPLNRTEIEGNLGFLYLIVDRPYGMYVGAIRAVDENDTILRDKMNGNSARSTGHLESPLTGESSRTQQHNSRL